MFAALNRQTENAFDVKRATGKKPAHVGRDAGWLQIREFQNDVIIVFAGAGLFPHHFSIGRTRRYHRIHFLLCVDAHVDQRRPRTVDDRLQRRLRIDFII